MTAVLDDDVQFLQELQYFLQVKLENINGKFIAFPLPGKGSGDFINLLQSDAYMELDSGSSFFEKGSVHRIWPFKNLY